MEDSFRVRVAKVFGALGGGEAAAESSSPAVSSSLWCLADEEIERREWNRDKEEVEDERRLDVVEPVPSDGRNDLKSDLQELSDYDEEDGDTGGEKRKRRWDGDNRGAETDADEYLDIQANIGRDCTLDFEEEEDAYDKLAVGDERKSDRMYMRDVKSVDYNINDYSASDELPNTFKDVVKDPRANHEAAKMRLQEDAEAAGTFNSLQLSDNSATTNVHAKGLTKGEVNGDNPRPILKKRENLIDSRSQKRVRFMIDPKDLSSGASRFPSVPDLRTEQVCDYRQDSSSHIPDYLKNPSKYTHYTFDSVEDMDDRSNQKAYMDFFQSLKKRNSDSSLDDIPAENPKSITFIPKRKPEERPKQNERQDSEKKKGWSIAVTAEEAEGSEASEMEEDDKSYPLQKPGRKYRTRSYVDVEEP